MNVYCDKYSQEKSFTIWKFRLESAKTPTVIGIILDPERCEQIVLSHRKSITLLNCSSVHGANG